VTAAPVLPRPSFAHASEAELARILDYYQVRWEYEPDTFPIGWSMTGDVVESFAPDFYLPDMDLYVELTTLKQKLVRKKNRKLRRLRELYPDVRIKLFYARDFRMLLLKFGRLALHDELSGTVGQATPPRPAEMIVAEAAGRDPVGAGTEDDLAGDDLSAAILRGDGLPADDTHEPHAAVPGPHTSVAAGAAHARGRRRGRRRHDAAETPSSTQSDPVTSLTGVLSEGSGA
jgi:hypothetical protein